MLFFINLIMGTDINEFDGIIRVLFTVITQDDPILYFLREA